MSHTHNSIVEWSPLYLDYITHYGETSSNVFRRSSVCIVGNMFQLSKWYVGCGFNPETVWYDSMEEAKQAGEAWYHKGV